MSTSQLTLVEAVGRRDSILDAFRENHKSYLAGVRAFAREIALREGSVTIDDVRDAMEQNDYPMPSDVGIDERVFGTLFRCKEFRSVGSRPTRREAFAARVGVSRSSVTVYRLVAA